MIRDNKGEVLATLMQSLSFRSQSSTIEARGLVTTAMLCKDLDMQNVALEGDSSQVVNAMRQSKVQNGILSCLVEDARAALLDTRW